MGAGDNGVRQRGGNLPVDAKTGKSSYDNDKKIRRESNKSGCCGRCCSKLYWLMKCLLTVVLLIAIVVVSALLIPNNFNAQPYRVHRNKMLRYSGKLEVNAKLSQAEHLFVDDLVGPESFAYHNHKLYTGTADGRIVEIKDGKIVRQVRVVDSVNEEECSLPTYWTAPSCGRPLGLRYDTKIDELVVADAYMGLIRVDMDLGTVMPVVDKDAVMDGPPINFANDLALMSDGTILFTDSSAKWQQRDYMKLVLEGRADGRLLKYDPLTEEVTTLIDNLHFANGVELVEDESAVYVAETGMARILIHHLSGPKAGNTAIFLDNLPGLPDNIRLMNGGILYVPMSNVRNPHRIDTQLYDWVGGQLIIRNLIGRLIPSFVLNFVDAHFGMKYGLVCIYNKFTKELLLSLHDPEGTAIAKVSQFFEAEDENGTVHSYIGSYNSRFLGHIKSKLPHSKKKQT